MAGPSFRSMHSCTVGRFSSSSACPSISLKQQQQKQQHSPMKCDRICNIFSVGCFTSVTTNMMQFQMEMEASLVSYLIQENPCKRCTVSSPDEAHHIRNAPLQRAGVQTQLLRRLSLWGLWKDRRVNRKDIFKLRSKSLWLKFSLKLWPHLSSSKLRNINPKINNFSTDSLLSCDILCLQIPLFTLNTSGKINIWGN